MNCRTLGTEGKLRIKGECETREAGTRVCKGKRGKVESARPEQQRRVCPKGGAKKGMFQAGSWLHASEHAGKQLASCFRVCRQAASFMLQSVQASSWLRASESAGKQLWLLTSERAGRHSCGFALQRRDHRS
eukprot:1142273-Pelagomonas_calceolata.AAC.5